MFSVHEAQGFESVEFQVAEHVVKVLAPAHDAREGALGPKAAGVERELELRRFALGECTVNGRVLGE